MQRSQQSLLVAIAILSLTLMAYAFAVDRVSGQRNALRQEEGLGLVMPSQVARIVALEFKGLFADVIFSRTMTYYGGRLIGKEKPTEEEWDWIYKNIDAATDLDNYFLDPYYFGAMNFAWGGKVKEANLLLEKAFRYRDWDWTIPFYLGFNYFYFLHDNEKAAFYLMEASKRPGAWPMIPSLAVRLAYPGKKTENAIIFLQEIIMRTEDEKTRMSYQERLAALKGILFLERAVTAYQDRFGRRPERLDDMITKNVIREIPKDPYGGEFYIDKDGSIKTTSELR